MNEHMVFRFWRWVKWSTFPFPLRLRGFAAMRMDAYYGRWGYPSRAGESNLE